MLEELSAEQRTKAEYEVLGASTFARWPSAAECAATRFMFGLKIIGQAGHLLGPGRPPQQVNHDDAAVTATPISAHLGIPIRRTRWTHRGQPRER